MHGDRPPRKRRARRGRPQVRVDPLQPDSAFRITAIGVDLATPAPYQALVARMNAIMDEIEAILARRK